MARSSEIIRAFDGAYKTTKVDRFIQVRSRCLFPDGHAAELYVPHHDPRIVLDLGETMQWLRAQIEDFEIGESHRRLLEQVCVSRQINYAHGMFLTRVDSMDHLSRGVDRLARATVWLAEMWLKDYSDGSDWRMRPR